MDGTLQRLAETRATVERHVIEVAVEVDRLVACDDAAHDFEVLACAGERARIGLPIPALHHLWTARAEAEDDSSVGEVVQRHRRHCGGRRRAGAHLHDAGAELHSFGVRAPPRQWRERITAICLGGPHRAVAQPLGFLDRLQRTSRRTAAPVSGAVTELQNLLYAAA